MGGLTQPNLAVGAGQTWQNVTASRSNGVTYTNTSGRPILIAVTLYQNGTLESGGTLYIDGIFVGRTINQTAGLNIGNASVISAVVPANSTYIINVSGTINNWAELK